MARKREHGQIRPKVFINVGLGLDLITGTFIYGKYGDSILNGGLPQFLTVAGPTNNFKSFVTNHWNLTAVNRVCASYSTYYDTYDTEINTNIERSNNWGTKFSNLDNQLLTGPNKHWTISDASLLKGDEWKADFTSFVAEQTKETKVEYQGMLDPYTNNILKLHVPTFFSQDTITEMKTTMTAEKLEKYKKDDGSDNMEAANLGKFKSLMLTNLPDQLIRANAYITLVAQISESIDLSGMYSPKPMKKLQYLKDVDTIKGVPRQFYSLPGLGLLFHNSKNLFNSDRKDVFYPSKKKNYMVNDLNKVLCTVLRNKSGHDGITLTILISKEDGVLEDLTAFHTIKDPDIGGGYGISGNKVSYHLDLYPDLTVGRTTIRDALEDNRLLAKATELTRDMFQLSIYKPELLLDGTLCSPKELYEDIKKLGYDWNVLLNTVSWHTPLQYADNRQALTIKCLLDMRKGTYKPYWLDDDNNVITDSKKYKKHILKG